MSLLPQIVYEVPEETARIARAAFPKKNPYLRLADTLGVIYQDGDFAQLFPFTGQPALAPVRLSADDHPAICRGAVRSPSRRCRAGPDGLEILARFGTD